MNMQARIRIWSLAYALWLIWGGQWAAGEQTWVQPYLGVTDSPFHLFGMDETLRVEDFESGEIVQPGVTLLPQEGLLPPTIEITSSVDQTTANSVAEDTSVITEGKFLLATPISCATTFPQLCPASVSFEFGGQGEPTPTFAGLVWTDAVRTSLPQANLPFAQATVYDVDGTVLATRSITDLPKRTDDVTADDLFVGFFNDQGIGRLEFAVTTDFQGGNLAVDHLQFGRAAIFGDVDRNGIVEFDDFSILAEHFGETGTWREGDFDFDGVVTFDDFVTLANHFGREFESSSLATVPEPSLHYAWLLVVLMFARGFVWRQADWSHQTGR